MGAIRLLKRPDGVAVITLDNPDGKVNIISRGVLEEIRPVVDELEADPAVKAVVLCSGKADNFIAGADLKVFMAVKEAAEGEAFSREGHLLLDRIESSPKPVVAAIRGACLGGGTEFALACHYRIAADDPSTVLALPEVQLGLLPGGGGTQRLPPLVGLPAALDMMLTGRRIRAKKALRMGLVDALTSPAGIEETAAKAALDLAEGRLKPKRKRPLKDRLMALPPLRTFVFRQAAKSVAAKTRGNYPAPPFILQCAEAGLARGRKAGDDVECRLFGQLTASPEAKALLGLFEAMTELKKRPEGDAPAPVTKLAVLGGGFMGSGIAAVSLSHVPVVVRDPFPESLQRCAKSVHEGLAKQVRSGALTAFQRDRLASRLLLTEDLDALKGAELIVEAVFEDLALKRQVLAQVEERVPATAVFASNTSALPIRDIAAEAKHPERVLGMHYFSPVPKMPLLELVVSEKTAPWATATARAFGVKQGKTVIAVKDGPGFYTTRILSPYLNEAIVLLEEGAAVDAVDRALKDFGYPVGPVALLDEVGIDVGAHVVKEFGQLFAHRGLGSSPVLPKLFEAGFSGRKNNKGFYTYPPKGKKGRKRPNPGVYAFLGGPQRKPLETVEAAHRCAFLMVNEAVICLQEEVIACPRDGDVGAILGLGFPPFRGGPFRFLDALGAQRAVELMERLAERFGPRFAPAPLLADMAKSGKRFYG